MDYTSCIVVKVGSSSLVTSGYQLNIEQMGRIVEQLCVLSQSGERLVLVTSGAVAAGAGLLQIPRSGMTLPEKQACAAVGQGVLMQAYHDMFSAYGIKMAQVLLTRDVFENRARYIHTRNTMTTLLDYGTVPIVNENDTVAVDEIRFGDNDALSAQVAALMNAKLLILLTDTDGLFTADPNKVKDARPIAELSGIDESILGLAGGSGSTVGTGGMRSKITAAQIASQSGIPVIIAKTSRDRVVLDAVRGVPVGTRINPVVARLSGKKRWIAHASTITGKVLIDDGAVLAICSGGKSLLASGITDVEGEFVAGDIVSIRSASLGREVGRGVVNYDAAEVVQLRGMTSRQIAQMHPNQRVVEVVHRDNLVTFRGVKVGM